MNRLASGAAVIFDLDGTLVDSAPDIAASVGHALRRMGREAPSLEQIQGYIGNGVQRLIHRSLTHDVDGIADEPLFEATCAHFFDHYAANVCLRSEPYPRVFETLKTLDANGYELACVTNKPARFTLPLLEQLGLGGYFSLTLSGDSLAAKKPAPDQLLYVAERHALAPRDCVVVGDTVTDVLAARHAHMPVICVTYGYGELAEMIEQTPTAIVDSIDQIVDLLPAAAMVQ